MDASVIAAIVTGAFTFLGVVVTVVIGNKKQKETVKAQTDLTLYRISELEKKQSVHNNLIDRTYKLEGKVLELQHEVQDLKGFHGIGPNGGTNRGTNK